MKQRLLFVMPDRLEPFIAATAAVQSLCFQLEEQARILQQDLSYEVDIYTPNSSFGVFCDVFKNRSTFMAGGSLLRLETTRSKYEMVFTFDERHCYRLGRITEKHMAHTFGLMIGGDPAGSYPTVLGDFSALKLAEPTTDILFMGLPSSYMPALKYFCEKNELTCGGIAEPSENDGDHVLQAIAAHRMVVGVRNSFTYLASSFKKKIVEVYPQDVYKRWLSKWANPQYQMIYEDRPTVATILRAMEAVWARPLDLDVSMAAR